ncbi:glycosyl hydrolase family 76-domain-containing protein [Myxozyma melibiosi]|uniref:Mannan endo-1,6-alpha-mannosidase n=1 Tax=Myxozyma melibiosi TaxID=54550 RepID=A0ABR1F864_9ASCO
MILPIATILFFTATCVQRVAAIDIDVTDTDSIINACFVFSHGLMSYYNGNTSDGTVGKFVSPYYWWEAGGAWGSLLDYWWYTGDETYNDQLSEAMLANVGPNWDFMPKSEVSTEGNDDQAFWAFVSMAAAERNFTNPPDGSPQWLSLTQLVFDSMAERWDTAYCGGGLRWQIFQFNNGYDYKNTISNAGFFMLGARLARYTGNDSYADWSEKVWDWLVDVGFLDLEYYYFYDGASVSDNCTEISKYQWTYNAAIFLAGSAYLYNYTESDVWKERVSGILANVNVFFDSSGVMFEAACERVQMCNTDQQSFKAYFARFLGLTVQLAPFTADTIIGLLQSTVTNGISQSCVGGSDGVTCGTTWLEAGWDNTWGLGQQMGALEVTQNLLALDKPAPFTSESGGSSPNVNSTGYPSSVYVYTNNITTADRAGAGILTTIALIMMLGMAWILASG